MKPLFTIHEGEFLVGEQISRQFGDQYEVWIPAKDDGIDLLVTHRTKRKPGVRIQVKHSRGFEPRHSLPREHADCVRGWYTLNPAKIRSSCADVWVFVILTLRHEKHFIVLPTATLRQRIPSNTKGPWHIYLSIWKDKKCFNTRDLSQSLLLKAIQGGAIKKRLNYSDFVNNWQAIHRLL